MFRSALLLLVLTALARVAFATSETARLEQDLTTIFRELGALKPMQRDRTYALPARGEELRGRNDDFLRRRTADEVSASGLSCGCGDFAAVFVDRATRLGYETLLVDAALISSQSLASTFSGHSVVAIRAKEGGGSPWWLIDSTALRVLSRDWSPQAKSFTASGQLFWIGYCGPLEKYPVRSPLELRKFYADTLATVPPEVFARVLTRFKFEVDASLYGPDGQLLNPQVAKLQALHDGILAKHGIEPQRTITVRLVRGADNTTSDFRLTPEGWTSRIGLKSACSPSYISSLEAKIHQTFGNAF
jgi:hypothetical protein